MLTLVSFFPVSPAAWHLAWSSDIPDATFRIFRDGRLILSTALTSATIPITPGTHPIIEILDDASDPTPAYPATVRLTWLAVADADSYHVDQYNGSTWATLATINDDGSAVFEWESNAQPDGQSATFRVVPVGTNGNAGTALSFIKFVVRFPDPPKVTYTYNAGTGEVTIAAA